MSEYTGSMPRHAVNITVLDNCMCQQGVRVLECAHPGRWCKRKAALRSDVGQQGGTMDETTGKVPFKDSGSRQSFASGAVRDRSAGKGRMDLVPYLAVWLVSRIYEDGAIKYAENNWMKGIPVKDYVKSAMNHLSKYMEGMRDEPHLSMAGWNILCAIWTAAQVQLGVFPQELGQLPVPADAMSPHEQLSLKTFYAGEAPPLMGKAVNVGKLPEDRILSRMPDAAPGVHTTRS